MLEILILTVLIIIGVELIFMYMKLNDIEYKVWVNHLDLSSLVEDAKSAKSAKMSATVGLTPDTSLYRNKNGKLSYLAYSENKRKLQKKDASQILEDIEEELEHEEIK